MRALLVWLACSAFVVVGSLALVGPFGGIAAAVAALAYLFVFAWLPRAAHRAFVKADFDRASRLFAASGWFRPGKGARQRSRLSRAACELGAGRWRSGLELAEGLKISELPEAELAVWNNNMAYALSRLEVRGGDALEHADAALQSRPRLAGFIHTRGIALLGLGRVDEAITVLEEAHSGEPNTEALEAERCYDLARAWLAKGEDDYACDYFDRSRRAAPSSSWAARATGELATRGVTPQPPPTDGIL